MRTLDSRDDYVARSGTEYHALPLRASRIKASGYDGLIEIEFEAIVRYLDWHVVEVEPKVAQRLVARQPVRHAHHDFGGKGLGLVDFAGHEQCSHFRGAASLRIVAV